MSNVLVVDDPVVDGLPMAEVFALETRVSRPDRADAMIVSLALKVEARDPGTGDHCRRLSRYASTLGRKFGLSEEEIATLDRGGYLHDIGKAGIPGAVLQKRGPLTSRERTLVEQHTVIGDRFCAGLDSLRLVRPIVRHHHERMDGSGYPDGLRGDEIPLLARIVGVVDVFDALMAERPYKTALAFDRAAEMLRKEAARGWRCTDIVDTFLNLIEGCGMIPSVTRAMPAAVETAGQRGARSEYAREIAGGGRGIRTPGTLSGSTVFKTAALNHSAIPPRRTTPGVTAARTTRS